jgi:cell division protein FtsN
MKGELIRYKLSYLQLLGARFRVCMHAYIFATLLCFPLLVSSQQKPEYFEIPLFFNVKGIGGTEVPALITDNNDIYLSVEDVFNFLRIRNTSSPGFDTISGFFIDENVDYLIDRVQNRIIVQDRVFDLKFDDLLLEETGLYMKTTVYGQVFGLVCTFDFRRLMVTLNTELELPLIREMRQEQVRSNLRRLKGEVEADTNIGRSYPGFHIGMADWSVYSTQKIDGKNVTRANFTLGTILAGGETNISLNWNNQSPFVENEQYYLWHFVKNDFKPLRQVFLGKIPFRSTSSIYEPVVGGAITNTPATYRQSFGSYTLADYTEPGWVVELYVNNVLIDYVQSDASGFYQFEVPLVYGNSSITLRFYGPWGEERYEERNIKIPFTFLPKKEFEYNISGGFVEDQDLSRYSRSFINYGLTNAVTIGGGYEYLSSVTSGPMMPFVNTSVRLGGSLLVSGEYTYGVVGKGILSYQTPKNLFLELYYSKYAKDQTAVIFNYLEERKAILSVPIRGKKFGAYTRFTLANQVIVPGKTWTRSELLFTGNFLGVNTNFTTYGIFSESARPNLYSDLSLGFRFNRGLTIIPMVQYNYTQGRFAYLKGRIEKPLLKYGFFTVTYEENFRTDMRSIEVGFRYDFSFAQASVSALRRNDETYIFSSARGSFIFDKKSKYLGAQNRPAVGRGGLVVLPFLDLNFNDIYDPGEPKIKDLNIRINGGRIKRTDRDTTIRVFDLMPYTTYLLQLDKNSFDNIAWQLPFETVNVAIDANKLKRIEVPVKVMGEGAGMVYLKKQGRKKGRSRIIVNFYTVDSVKVGRVISEFDGYFSYLGLPTGSYYARLDTNQLRKLNMKSVPSSIPFEISPDIDGDIVDNLEFTLQRKVADSIVPLADTTELIVAADTAKPVAEAEPIQEEVLPVIGDMKGVYIQVGAYKSEGNAMTMEEKLKDAFDLPVAVTVEDGYHKVRLMGFDTRDEAVRFIPKLVSKGFPEWYVIRHTGDAVALGVVIEAGKYRRKADAVEAQRNLMDALGKPVMVAYEDGKYVVYITGFESYASASRQIRELITAGYYDAHVYGRISSRALAGVAIQAGEYGSRAEAIAVQQNLKAVTGHPVMIIAEKGKYRLRVTGFRDDAEAVGVIPDVLAQGYKETYLINQQGEKIPLGAVVQVAAYERESTALAARKNLKGVTGKGRRALVMVEELAQPDEDLNKVRVSGFADTMEMKRLAPKLVTAGFPDSDVGTTTYRKMLKGEDGLVSPMKRKAYALQVRRQLPVLVINENGKSKVWIIGFATMEEAEQFMPSLTSAGYPGAFIVKRADKKAPKKMVIEVGSYETREEAVAVQKKLVRVIGRYALITIEGLRPIDESFNKVTISGFIDSTEMMQAIPQLVSEGFPESSVDSRTQINVIEPHGLNLEPIYRQSFALPVTGKDINIVKEQGVNKLRITTISGRPEAEAFVGKLKEKGFKGSYIVDGPEQEIPFEIFIQAGSYQQKKNALRVQQQLIDATGKPVVIVKENNIYKVRLAGFKDSLQASTFLPRLVKLGYPNPFIIHTTNH